MKKTINIDGEIYEECDHREHATTPRVTAMIEDTEGNRTYYRLKPREPRTWEGTVRLALSGNLYVQVDDDLAPAGTRVKVTEILEG